MDGKKYALSWIGLCGYYYDGIQFRCLNQIWTLCISFIRIRIRHGFRIFSKWRNDDKFRPYFASFTWVFIFVGDLLFSHPHKSIRLDGWLLLSVEKILYLLYDEFIFDDISANRLFQLIVKIVWHFETTIYHIFCATCYHEQSKVAHRLRPIYIARIIHLNVSGGNEKLN